MGLNIKNPDTERMVRRLVAATGESVTQAVTVAVEERLDRLERMDVQHAADRMARIREIAEDAAGRWREPFLTADHADLLYDEAGLPR